MIRICADTNAFFTDPLLRSTNVNRLLKHAERGVCVIHLSPVVDAELARQVSDAIRSDGDALRARIRNLADRHAVPVDGLLGQVQSLVDDLTQEAAARRAELRTLEGLEFDGWPTVTVSAIVQRELDRRRPFVDVPNKGTIGHRDTIIWLGVLAVAAANPGDTIYLVTKDNGFLKDGALHPDLSKDLSDADLASDQVSVLPDIFNVLAAVDREFAAERPALIRVAVREALHDYNRELRTLQWTSWFDPRDGGTIDPQIDAALPPELENVTVSYIESDFDITLEPADPAPGQTATCTYDIDMGFEGAMEKFEWFSQDHDDLELWDADWNDHYVQVHAERRLRMTARVTYHDETDSADIEEIVTAVRLSR